jgi:hypothetical protein
MKRVKGATLSYTELEKYFAYIPVGELRENDDFVNGRHWENGKYWIGWRPMPDEKGSISEAAVKQWQYVCQSFSHKNVIGSNLNRLEGAIIGNEPNFNIIPADYSPLDDPVDEANRAQTESEKLFEGIDDLIVDWWTQKEIHQVLKTLLRSKASYGKTALLINIPSGYLVEKKQMITVDGKMIEVSGFAFEEDNPTFEDVLSRIHVQVIHYNNVIDVEDREFGRKFTIVRLNSSTNEQGEVFDKIGVYFVDSDNLSYFRVVDQNNNSNEIRCDLGGNNLCLTFGEYLNALVTPSVKRLQMDVNHAETGVNYALANINYPETTFINAAEITQRDERGNDTGKAKTPLQGLGVFRHLRGLLTETINGQQLSTPSIHERDGADPEKFAKVSEQKARDIDMMMGMDFKNLIGSEYASGKSKNKSMDDLDILITGYETTMNTIGTKLIENVIRLAFNFTNQTDKNKDFKVLFRVNVSQGKLTNEDKTGMREEVAQGLRSEENYILLAKVSDTPKREKQLIAAQPPKQLNPPTPPTDPIPKPSQP